MSWINVKENETHNVIGESNNTIIMILGLLNIEKSTKNNNKQKNIVDSSKIKFIPFNINQGEPEKTGNDSLELMDKKYLEKTNIKYDLNKYDYYKNDIHGDESAGLLLTFRSKLNNNTPIKENKINEEKYILNRTCEIVYAQIPDNRYDDTEIVKFHCHPETKYYITSIGKNYKPFESIDIDNTNKIYWGSSIKLSNKNGWAIFVPKYCYYTEKFSTISIGIETHKNKKPEPIIGLSKVKK